MVKRKTIPLKSPQREGEETISGHMSDIESDDVTLKNAQDVGFQLDEEEEHPKPLSIARDIDKAERHKREH